MPRDFSWHAPGLRLSRAPTARGLHRRLTALWLHDAWLLTGDMGSMNGDGVLVLRDRSEDVIISGGSSIDHAAIRYETSGVPNANCSQR